MFFFQNVAYTRDLFYSKIYIWLNKEIHAGHFYVENMLVFLIIRSPNNGMRVIHCPQKVKGQENCIWTAKDDAVINSMSKSVVLYINNMEFNVEKSFRKDFTHQRRCEYWHFYGLHSKLLKLYNFKEIINSWFKPLNRGKFSNIGF